MNIIGISSIFLSFSIQVAELSELKASKEQILKDNSTLKANATELDANIKGLQNKISTLTDGKKFFEL